MILDAKRMKRLRRTAPWALFALAATLCSLGLWLQVQMNSGLARPGWVPAVDGLSTVALFARIAAGVALAGILILALRPVRSSGTGAGGGLPRVGKRKFTVPLPRRDGAKSAAAQPATADPLARLAAESGVAATIRQRQVARRARDIIAARQAEGAQPA